MTKKEYVIKLLTSLQDERPLAKGLLLLIEGGKVGDDTIGALAKIFADAVHKVHVKINSDKINKSVEILHKIQELESRENQSLEELDRALENEIESMIQAL